MIKRSFTEKNTEKDDVGSIFSPNLGLGFESGSGVRLRDHIGLRWLAVVGQTSAVGIAYFVWAVPLWLLPLCAVIALSVALNLWLVMRYPPGHLLSRRQAAHYLIYDLAQLSVLLWLTGGLANPFAVLLLAPVTVTASLADLRFAFVAVVLAVIAVIVLFLGAPFLDFAAYVSPSFVGVAEAAGLALALVFIPVYIWWVSRAGRRLLNANATMGSLLARAQHLSALDGLAAAAAHQLGTPLGTIFLISGELSKSSSDVPPETPPETWQEDMQLIRIEAEKCRAILSNLTRPNESHLMNDDVLGYDMITTAPLSDVITAMIAARQTNLPASKNPPKQIHFSGATPVSKDSSEPHIRHHPELTYGIGNVLDNALAFAAENIWIKVGYDDTYITIEISDDGKGFAPDVLARLGSPYNRNRSSHDRAPDDKGGLGLGFFIAQSLLARLSGQVVAYNNPIKGACVSMKVPRAAVSAVSDILGD
ncbi:MAG: ActS/PrrB/RegB family redox-sensitive histidine kinase [Alphaproteobacteria bacterium]|nr:ActS/PrrB/RegB family redox-sensitive histidine kinase [Alphaproteobacteria bacterium]